MKDNHKGNGNTKTRAQASANILVVEDDEGLSQLMQENLQQAGFDAQVVSNGAEAMARISNNSIPLLLMDYQLPDMSGKQLIETLTERQFNVPFVVVTGQGNEKVAVEMMKLGARDYLLKDTAFFDILPLSVERVLEQLAIEKELSDTVEKMWIKDAAIDSSTNSIAITDLIGNLTYVNTSFLTLWRYDNEEDVLGRHLVDFLQMQMKETAAELIKAVLEKGEWEEELVARRKDGSIFDISLSANIVTNNKGNPICMMAFFTDITERKRAEEKLEQSLHRLQRALNGAIQAIALTGESKDPYTASHQRRVTALACAIAKEMRLLPRQVEGIRMAATIHDIGMISIPSEIVSKSGQLTESELSIVRDHPKIGYDILKEIEFPWPIADIILQHHERIDGSGYPAGLSDKDILLEAKILGVADIVEAMASHRPYRPALGIDKALEEISQKKGTLYDVQTVDACLRLFEMQEFKFDE